MTSSLSIGLLISVGLSLGACSKQEASTAKSAAIQTPAAPAAKDPSVVNLAPELDSRVSAGELLSGQLTETIRLAGRLNVNQYKTANIGAPITGRISDIDGVFGQSVKAGQTLATLNSPDLAQSQLNFLRANTQEQLNIKAVERAQLLLNADVIGSAELQRRQSELTVVQAEKRAASDQLRSLGMSAQRIATLEKTGQIQSSIPVVATLSGVVIDRKVSLGQVVQPADTLFVVSDLNTLWAQAEVPEQDARFVKLNSRVEVEIPALDNQRFFGKVAFVSDLVNPQTRTVLVGVELANPERNLKPAMLMTMLIEGRTSQVQQVPLGAVVREEDKDYLFIRQTDGRYKLTQIELGPEKDGKRPLIRPLPTDTQLIVDGAFHLNNVRQQQALQGK